MTPVYSVMMGNRDAATYDLCKVSARAAGESRSFGDQILRVTEDRWESSRACACSFLVFGHGRTLAEARSDRIRAHRRHAKIGAQ
jgi:hypothetical protein